MNYLWVPTSDPFQTKRYVYGKKLLGSIRKRPFWFELKYVWKWHYLSMEVAQQIKHRLGYSTKWCYLCVTSRLRKWCEMFGLKQASDVTQVQMLHNVLVAHWTRTEVFRAKVVCFWTHPSTAGFVTLHRNRSWLTNQYAWLHTNRLRGLHHINDNSSSAVWEQLELRSALFSEELHVSEKHKRRQINSNVMLF